MPKLSNRSNEEAQPHKEISKHILWVKQKYATNPIPTATAATCYTTISFSKTSSKSPGQSIDLVQNHATRFIYGGLRSTPILRDSSKHATS